MFNIFRGKISFLGFIYEDLFSVNVFFNLL